MLIIHKITVRLTTNSFNFHTKRKNSECQQKCSYKHILKANTKDAYEKKQGNITGL